MLRRATSLVALTLGLVIALAFAVKSAQSAATLPIAATMQSTRLLFDSATWLVWLAPFAGLVAAGLSRRRGAVIEGDRVLRHDGAAILEHWSHATATVILVLTGLALGARGLLPRFVSGAADVGVALNIHYVGTVIFGFGAAYYAANSLLSGRWREHLPHELGASGKSFIAHYRAVFTRSELPPAGKYFASEHLTYPMAIGGSILVLVTGLLKVAAHSLDIPAGLMGAATLTHDIAAILLGFFLVAHAIAGAIVPWSWPLLRSMVTGYVTTDYAKHHHSTWYAELTETEAEPMEERPAA